MMLLLFGTPMAVGLANYLVPLQIGAADMAFPRAERPVVLAVPVRRARSCCRGFLVRGGPAGDRLDRLRAAERRDRTSRAPASTCGSSGWRSSAISGVLGAINFIATIYGRRAPGHDDASGCRSSPGTSS